jgi:hypothetical protein
MLPIRRTLLTATIAASALVGPLATTAAPAAAAPKSSGAYTEFDVGQVGGTYTPVVGDFSDVDYYDDLLWYAPGAGAETLWTGTGNAFTKKSLGNVVGGTYTPLVGDFTGDGLDDIFWYGPGAKPDTLWQSSGAATFTNIPVSVGGTYAPLVIDDLTGKDDILWANPNGGAGSIWSFTGTGAQHQSHAVSSVAGAKPLTGDFDGDHYGDIFWYGPGAIADALWSGNGSGAFATKVQNVSGTYTPMVAQLTPHQICPKCLSVPDQFAGGQDESDDIFWFRSSGQTAVWYGRSDRNWDQTLGGTFDTTGTLLPGNGDGTAFLWSPTQPDKIWSDGGIFPTGNTEMGAGYTPIVGNWYGSPGVLFYKPGPAPERLFT